MNPSLRERDIASPATYNRCHTGKDPDESERHRFHTWKLLALAIYRWTSGVSLLVMAVADAIASSFALRQWCAADTPRSATTIDDSSIDSEEAGKTKAHPDSVHGRVDELGDRRIAVVWKETMVGESIQT